MHRLCFDQINNRPDHSLRLSQHLQLFIICINAFFARFKYHVINLCIQIYKHISRLEIHLFEVEWWQIVPTVQTSIWLQKCSEKNPKRGWEGHSCLKWPLEEIYNLIFENLTYSAILVPNWKTWQKYFFSAHILRKWLKLSEVVKRMLA